MEKQVKEILEKYFDELQKEHKEYYEKYRIKTKQPRGQGHGYVREITEERIVDHKRIKNVIEQKLHIKRLLKLMNER